MLFKSVTALSRLATILLGDLHFLQQALSRPRVIALHPIEYGGNVTSYVHSLSLTSDYERMVQQFDVLWSDGLVLHQAEVDKVDEVNGEDVFVVVLELRRVAMHHLSQLLEH